MSQYLSERILGATNVRVQHDAEITGLQGEQRLERIRIGSRTTKEANWAVTPRLFVAIGGAPNTDWAAETAIVRDQGGYLVTGPDLLINGKAPASWPLERAPYYLETAVPGPSRPGTCATARSSASPPLPVRARWPSLSFTDTWKKLHDPVHEQPRLWRGSTVLESLTSATHSLTRKPTLLSQRYAKAVAERMP